MQKTCNTWLGITMDIYRTIGLLPENVYFCPDADGQDRKGVLAKTLQLSYFLDDRQDVLRSVLSDKAGNASEFVNMNDGQLFHLQP